MITCLTGTIFERSKLPLAKLLMIMLCFAHKESYTSAQRALTFSAEDTEVSHHAISDWYAALRQHIVEKEVARTSHWRNQIGGVGKIVQIDEALVGKRKYHRGRLVPELWVFGMIDEDNNVRMELCEKRDMQTLESFIVQHIKPGSTIHSDGWAAYRDLSVLGFDHHVVNHSVEFVTAEGVHTQKIESQWRQMRKKLSPGGIRRDDVGDHLVEYVWRKRCENEGLDPFESLIDHLKIE